MLKKWFLKKKKNVEEVGQEFITSLAIDFEVQPVTARD